MEMEPGPLPAHGESGRAANRVGSQPLPQQEAQARNAKTPNTLRYRRIPLGITHDGERIQAAGGSLVATTTIPTGTMSNIHPSPAGQSKPLLPVTERRSYGEMSPGKKSKTGGHDDGKTQWNMTPDGGSAGREGRQFAVWNVGNNGRIYLRPSVRPAHQRFPQPQFVFPLTPPGTMAGVDVLAPTRDQQEVKQHEDASLLIPENQLTPSYLSSTPVTSYLGVKKKSLSGARHRRAMSDSTVPDSNIIAQEQDPGGFRIVITQPGDEHRPKTVDAFDPNKGSLLEVSIPSWKLGTPRFSIRGTPFLRGSSYAPTEDIRHSSTSIVNHTPRELTPRQSRYNQVTHVDYNPLDPSPARTVMVAQLPPLRSTYLSPHTSIEPAMFDALTFKPACDDRSIVRYSPNTRMVTAATPPRLVAEITSSSFLDYDLISDFFLTFRTFLDCADLIRMLIARLRWAFDQPDKEIGTVVRVRTFVAVRHWILNYFSEDFVANSDLRIIFCDLVNGLMEELSSKPHSNKAWIKILVEIKRCWRGACAQYWDGPEHEPTASPYEPIHPGGIPGHRDSKLDPSPRNKVEAWAPRLDDIVLPHATGNDSGFFADFSRAAHIDSVIKDDRPATPEAATADTEADHDQTSPLSIASLDVISCSFPTKNLRSAAKGVQPHLAAHPVEPSSIYAAHHDPVATTPRSLMGKRVRNAHSQRKRNGSLSDSLREQGMSTTTAPPMMYQNAEFLLKMPYGGNLVRGNIMPPGQAFVEVDAAGSDLFLSRQTTMVDQSPTDSHRLKLPASAMSGHGMKRLLGGVRRALSTRVDLTPPTQGSFINIPPIGPRGATTNRLPGTAIVPQAQPRPLAGNRPLVRIDLLAAETAEDFKKAVREGAAEVEKQTASASMPDTPEETPLYSAAHMDGESALRHVSDMAITAGSQSIVIVDDTIPAGFPTMSGAIPTSNASVEAFADSFMPNLADPTPPDTPVDRPADTPRRSSYILSQQAVQPAPDSHPLPPFVPELGTLGRVQSSGVRPFKDTTTQASMDYTRQSPHRPPLSGRRGHLRHPSSRSHHSLKSLQRPRYASFTSGITPQATIRIIRSFDATTCSAGSVIDGMSDVPIPQPLRVLRRRPGGDLRAITKAGGLDPGSLRRSRSVGSLSTFTDSIRGSYMHTARPASSRCTAEAIGSNDSPENAKVFSLGAIAEQHPTRQLSLFSTHSSKPVMRPSFEAEAQKLAQIPDDIDDDGGVESALLKLEGKFEKRTPKLPVSMQFEGPPRPAQDTIGSVHSQLDDLPIPREEKMEHRHVQVEDDHIILAPATASNDAAEMNSQSVPDAGKAEEQGQSFLSDDSRTSYTSSPLLDRGLTEDSVSRKTLTAEWTNRSIYQGPEEEDGLILAESIGLDSQHPSYDFVRKSESMEKIAPGETLPAIIDPRQSTEVSFLDVDTDDDTDLSSEMSLEFLASNDDDDVFPALKSSPLDAALPQNPLEANPTGSEPGLASREELFSPHGARSHTPEKVPPSSVNPPNCNKIPIVHEHQLWGEKPLPPTPDTTPTTGCLPHSRSFGSSDPTGTREALRHAPTLDIPDPVPQHSKPPEDKYSVHLPFILAFESDVLAQQFTLVEKDALAEIDWKDLIDMKWKNAEQTGTNTRSWVSFLRDTDARGVEVVIARFNIMVKWAVSEIVLTQDLEERARCIIKCIHIAGHCRRYRNFATMSQFTIALTSPEISRLSRTWDLVPAKDIQSLRELEGLISPTRNFYNLRKEMEGGGSPGLASTDVGCIPFVGIYTHDLIFNAQRPSEIASSPTTPPLVNFERCRIAASVVKTLLRLLEASNKYQFQPIEGLTERCLWMSALSDEEMRRLAQSLE